MKEQKKHRLKFNLFLEKLYQSDKALIIYKVNDGYNLYTDFSKKIILSNKNINKFLNIFSKKKYKKETDLYVGFFGYEILCNLLNIKLKKQKKLNFYKGIFYKPETIIKIRDNITILSNIKKNKFKNSFNQTKILSPFRLNINFEKYIAHSLIKIIRKNEKPFFKSILAIKEILGFILCYFHVI